MHRVVGFLVVVPDRPVVEDPGVGPRGVGVGGVEVLVEPPHLVLELPPLRQGVVALDEVDGVAREVERHGQHDQRQGGQTDVAPAPAGRPYRPAAATGAAGRAEGRRPPPAGRRRPTTWCPGQDRRPGRTGTASAAGGRSARSAKPGRCRAPTTARRRCRGWRCATGRCRESRRRPAAGRAAPRRAPARAFGRWGRPGRGGSCRLSPARSSSRYDVLPKGSSPSAIANLPYSGCGHEISLPGSHG